ncbi:Prephenate dehydratase-associated ABC transporter, substrate-binding protein [hydrothermal vent metagenome]|uniref:Prephenate dehydratase-associated ABC transporter, substrate-binding protein n=1 Tax=hydrothermal vent metagenome TaxID=652676 RepID=A0A3B0T393_9ZZZZ
MIRFLFVVGIFLSLGANVASSEPRHGLSAFGDLKYPADFKNFDYVNPDAPKRGYLTTLGTQGRTTFDNLNGFILKGEPAQNLGLLFDTLMVRAADEPDAMYGLVAETADVADDRMSVTFVLRKQAKFSDGTPITANDVAFTFRLLKDKGHPGTRIAIRDVENAKAIDLQTVRFNFKGKNVRDLPLIVAGLPVLSKAYYTKNDFTKTTLIPPLGSGPYKISDLKQGQFITYELRSDYWAKALPVNRGRYNFSVIKLLYFRDRGAELEALKAGLLDLREEFTSKSWATEYKIDAVKDGRLILATIPDENASGAQGFFINTRLEKFKDIRTRMALGLAFDFEWTNKNLFFNLYERTTSFFENSDMKAKSKIPADELALLREISADLRTEVFGDAVVPPVSDGSGQDRKLLRMASRLLTEAGWELKDGKRVSAKGEPLTVEFLIFSSGFERIIAPFVRNLKLLGVDAAIRYVEAAQYQERTERFDFDIVTRRYTMSQTPGVELRSFFGSKNADVEGSFNLSGLKSKAVDKLIDTITQAKTREELYVGARALDRVLRAEHLWVPHWYKASHNIAYWDIFGMPAVKPKFARGVFDTWWIDQKKSEAIKKGP